MRKIAMLAAALAVTMASGCASYADGYYGYGYYGWYDGWGGDGRDGRHSRSYGGGRSEPGNEAGMFPGRPGDGRGSVGGGGGGSRGGEAGSR
jgi:hypothetical protein